MRDKHKQSSCPCGGVGYEQCCARFIVHGQVAQTAEELMRSRYSAYVVQDEAYLRKTWDERSCPKKPLFDEEENIKWLGLEVRRHEQDGDAAIVEFVARYKVGGKALRLHEVSRFERVAGQWFYVDGSFPES